MKRALGALTVLALTLSAAGCGTRLSHEAAVEATRVTVTADPNAPAAPGGLPDAGPAAAADPAAVGATTGNGAPAPGAAKPGAAAPQAGGTAATGSPAGNRSTGKQGSASAPKVANKSPITLGNLGTYTGVIGESLKGLQEALQVWAASTNAAGGLNGHPVKVIIGNDGGDPSTALTIAKRMVTQDKILAFFDPFLLFDFNEIISYASSVNVPLIGGDGTDPRWYTTPIAFPQTATIHDSVRAVNKVLIEDQKSKTGIIYCVEIANLCAPIADDVKTTTQQLGGQFVFSASASFTAPSFTSICLNAQRAGVQGLWVFLDSASESRLARDCKAQGYTPRFVIASIVTTEAVLSDPNLDGTLIQTAVFPAPAADTPATKAFHAAFERFAPALAPKLSGTSAQAWAAGQLAIVASKFLSDNPTSAEFIQGLRSIKNNTLGGLTTALTFTEKGASHGKCSFVAAIENGHYSAPRGSKLIC
jgi:branched-chain amino acid transport system substrate-binding protein